MNHTVKLCGFAHERRGELCSTQDRSANIVCPHSIWNIVVPNAARKLQALGVLEEQEADSVIARWDATQVELNAADTQEFSAAEKGQVPPADSVLRQGKALLERQKMIAELRSKMQTVKAPNNPLKILA